MKTLLIDNYDSYTYNLYQLIAEVTEELPIVIKNDQLTWEELLELDFDNVVISPGPGRPEREEDFGICHKVLKELDKPILGVCLGHQGICHVYGGKVNHAPEVMHGRISEIYHHADTIFANIPNRFKVVRYHSLICADNLPACLETIAWTNTGLIMGLKHKHKPIWGVQFHPESICTEYGDVLIKNFIELSKQFTVPLSITKDKNRSKYTSGLKDTYNYNLLIEKHNFYCQSNVFFEEYLCNQENIVWLDSSKVIAGLSRFTIIGLADGSLGHTLKYTTSTKTIELTYVNGKKEQYTESIFEFLNKSLSKYRVPAKELPCDFHLGYLGYLGYELKGECTSIVVHHAKYPDAMFLFADRAIIFDHLEKNIYLLSLYPEGDSEEKEQSHQWCVQMREKLTKIVNQESNIDYFSKHQQKQPPSFYFSQDRQMYIESINKCLQYINDGETYEICLTNQIHGDFLINPLDYYMILRNINPAPYAAFIRFQEIAIACSSVERFLKIDRNKVVETKPIKGTLKRGKDTEEDQKFIYDLENDEKFRSENLMIVDLLRNDLGMVCEIGSVKVPKLMKVETYPTLHQLVTTITGKIKDDTTSIDCIKACFPGGSMTGAPKIRTMDIIDRLELEARGIYSGTIGYISLNGTVDLNIVIRTAVISANHFSLGVGGAIIALSSPEEEFDEIILKAKSLLNAVEYYFTGKLSGQIKIQGE